MDQLAAPGICSGGGPERSVWKGFAFASFISVTSIVFLTETQRTPNQTLFNYSGGMVAGKGGPVR